MTTSGFTLVSQEQESKAIMHTDSPKLYSRRLENTWSFSIFEKGSNLYMCKKLPKPDKKSDKKYPSYSINANKKSSQMVRSCRATHFCWHTEPNCGLLAHQSVSDSLRSEAMALQCLALSFIKLTLQVIPKAFRS